jgi:hypothetical protein
MRSENVVNKLKEESTEKKEDESSNSPWDELKNFNKD